MQAKEKPGGGGQTGQRTEGETLHSYNDFSGQLSSEITVTYWQDVQGTRKKEATSPWPEFVEWLPTVPRQPVKEKSPLIKFARFGETRTDKGCLRHDANVVEVTGIEGDVDNNVISFDEAVERLERHHVKAVVVTSHSYAPDNQRYRILTPLSKPCIPAEREKYVAILNGILDGNLGPESFNLSQSYFIGGRPGGEYRVQHTFDDPGEGYCLDESELDHLINPLNHQLR